MTYYIMDGEGVYPIRTIASGPDLPGGPWYHGHKLRFEVPTPLHYVLDEQDRDEDEDEGDYLEPVGNLNMLYDCDAFPIMHDCLVAALKAAGVGNLQLFPARILDPDNAVVHKDYQAFNVVGLVAAADVRASTLMDESSEVRHLSTNFDSLVLDEEKAIGFDLFRLAENCSAICVSEKVKREIEARNIPGIVFYGPGEWSG